MQKTGLTRFSLILGWSGKGGRHLWMWSLWGTQEPFSCALSHFWHGDNQPNNRVILEQACSWPVRRQFFLHKKVGACWLNPGCLICTFSTSPSLWNKTIKAWNSPLFSQHRILMSACFWPIASLLIVLSFFFWWTHRGLKGHLVTTCWRIDENLVTTWSQLTNKSRHSHVCRPYDVGGGSLGHWGADVVWKRLYSQRAGRGLCWQVSKRRRRRREELLEESNARVAQLRPASRAE